MQYTEEELQHLHSTLYGILAEIDRVCTVLNIPYFIQGGSGIGAFFEQAILPWDDDIDVGMTRKNYERFLREAPSVLAPEYFLQWIGSDPHTPYYFSKLMRRGTAFIDRFNKDLNIEKGIYVDIFPYDKVPDTPWLQKAHRTWCNFLNCCFMGKDIWLWKWFGKPTVLPVRKRNAVMCALTRLVVTLLPKKTIYAWLCHSLAFFNFLDKATFYNMVLMPKDHISVDSIEHPQKVKFGPLEVWAPSDLETYLRRHYRNLRRYIPKEEQQNHRPDVLSFAD